MRGWVHGKVLVLILSKSKLDFYSVVYFNLTPIIYPHGEFVNVLQFPKYDYQPIFT